MSKHTPGPLEVYDGGNSISLGRPGFVKAVEEGPYHGATVGELARASLRHGYTKAEFAEALANMRLFAVASELLVALTSVAMEWPYDADDGTCECGEFCDSESEAYAPLNGAKPSCRHTRAHAAIAKASKHTGGTTRGSFLLETCGSDSAGWRVQAAPGTVFFHTKTRAEAMRRAKTMEHADALLSACADAAGLLEGVAAAEDAVGKRNAAINVRQTEKALRAAIAKAGGK